MTTEIIKMLKQDLSQIWENADDVVPSDIDRLQVLSEAVSDSLPSKFEEILDLLARNYDNSEGDENILEIERLLRILETQEQVSGFKANKANTNLIPLFELGQQDRKRVEKLCAQMRKVVFSTTDFDEPHRLRLLNRIAAIEAEIHKPQGKFDVVRGGINDLGETLGKFGKDIKPLTDRMQEVVSIARKGTRAYDQLPEPDEVKQLPAPDEEDGGE